MSVRHSALAMLELLATSPIPQTRHDAGELMYEARNQKRVIWEWHTLRGRGFCAVVEYAAQGEFLEAWRNARPEDKRLLFQLMFERYGGVTKECVLDWINYEDAKPQYII